MSTKKKRGRPKIKGEKKITRSIRIKPSKIKELEQRYGTVQKWIDFNLELEEGGIYEAIIEKEE